MSCLVENGTFHSDSDRNGVASVLLLARTLQFYSDIKLAQAKILVLIYMHRFPDTPEFLQVIFSYSEQRLCLIFKLLNVSVSKSCEQEGIVTKTEQRSLLG